MITPGTSSDPTGRNEGDASRMPQEDDAFARLRSRVTEAAAEISRLRLENSRLRSDLETRAQGDPGAALGLPDDPAERRVVLDEFIRTVDFYIKRDS